MGNYKEGGLAMATSSIFASFQINDKETAERFANALDKSASEPEWKPTNHIVHLTDPKKIKELWAKRETLE